MNYQVFAIMPKREDPIPRKQVSTPNIEAIPRGIRPLGIPPHLDFPVVFRQRRLELPPLSFASRYVLLLVDQRQQRLDPLGPRAPGPHRGEALVSGGLAVAEEDLDEVNKEGEEARDSAQEVEPPETLEVEAVRFELCVLGAARARCQPLVMDPLEVPVLG